MNYLVSHSDDTAGYSTQLFHDEIFILFFAISLMFLFQLKATAYAHKHTHTNITELLQTKWYIELNWTAPELCKHFNTNISKNHIAIPSLSKPPFAPFSILLDIQMQMCSTLSRHEPSIIWCVQLWWMNFFGWVQVDRDDWAFLDVWQNTDQHTEGGGR